MSKITKSFRFDSQVNNDLQALVNLYTKLDIYNGKKVTATDVVQLLIQKEKQELKDKGYQL